MADFTKEDIITSMTEAAERMGLDLEDLTEMIPEVIEDCKEKAINLKSSIQAKDADSVKAIAHDIKGSSANYGLNQPSEVAKAIEEAHQEASLELADRLIAQFEALSVMDFA